INTGRYLLMGALGFGGGLLLTRGMARHLEFDADRMGALLTGSSVDEYAAMLNKLGAGVRKISREEMSHKPELTTVAEKIKDYMASKWKDLMRATVDAHPTNAEREASLRHHFRDSVAASRQGAQHTLGA